MASDLRAAAVALALFSGSTGIAYPLLVTGVSAVAFPAKARGSVILRNGRTIGSALVGQSFTRPEYLWGRPSAIELPYDARTSRGSNLGPTNPTLDALVRERIASWRVRDSDATGPIPVELVTASASGLDPHLSPAAAMYQVRRIARTRGIDSAVVAQLISAHIEPRTFGILGEPRVNVLRVNLSLDSLSTSPGPDSVIR